MQSGHHEQGLGKNLGAQLTLMTVAILAVLVIAWFYVF
jgi:hypothetical protein